MEFIKVGIRIRPFLSNEQKTEKIIHIKEHSLTITNKNHYLTTKFDSIFPEDSTQAAIFEFISPSIQSFLKGFNCTIFAYGQTGSGKTFTMFGYHWEVADAKETDSKSLLNLQSSGVVPRSISQIFQCKKLKQSTVYTSFLQIYKEKIYDLLSVKNAVPLKIRESKKEGIFVEGLSEYVVESENDCLALLSKGNSNKYTRTTSQNIQSSRSHSIFQIQIESNFTNKKGNLVSSKISLCDLAGSEKYDKEGPVSSEHLQEMTQINKSLSILGKVIQELTKKFTLFVPYRESKLTRILQNSLGRSSKTVLIATVSQSADFIDETINTLKFADRAKQVMIRSKKNEVSALNNEVVSKLQEEIARLKSLLRSSQQASVQELHKKLENLTEENKVLKKKTSFLTVDEVENLKIENKRLKLELQNLGIVQNARENEARKKDYSENAENNLDRKFNSEERIVDRSNALSPLFRRISPATGRSNYSEICLENLKVRLKGKSSVEVLPKIGRRDEVNIQKQIKIVKGRLKRIAEMERVNKIKFKEELERLESERKKGKLKTRKIGKEKSENLQDLYLRKREEVAKYLS